MSILGWILYSIGCTIVLASLLPYLIWHFTISFLCKDQNLKRRYDATWALVTGASSGALQVHHALTPRFTDCCDLGEANVARAQHAFMQLPAECTCTSSTTIYGQQAAAHKRRGSEVHRIFIVALTACREPGQQ